MHIATHTLISLSPDISDSSFSFLDFSITISGDRLATSIQYNQQTPPASWLSTQMPLRWPYFSVHLVFPSTRVNKTFNYVCSIFYTSAFIPSHPGQGLPYPHQSYHSLQNFHQRPWYATTMSFSPCSLFLMNLPSTTPYVCWDLINTLLMTLSNENAGYVTPSLYHFPSKPNNPFGLALMIWCPLQ